MKLFFMNREGARKSQGLLLALMGLLFWVGPTWSETAATDSVPKLSASIEKNTVNIGDLLWVTLRYTIPEDATLTESGGVQGLDALSVIQQTTAPHEIRFRILVDQLESFDLGPFGLTYVDHQGKEQQLTADPVAITVLSNLGEKPGDATIKPIEDIILTRSRWRPYLTWTLGVLALLGMISFFLWRRSRRRSLGLKTAMEEPPHIKAEREIDNLIASGLFETGNVKAFYFIFSETIRRYMESIRRFPAAEMTTEEIAKVIKTDVSDQTILPLLRQADLVKFADAIPAPDRKEQDVLAARSYIQQTRPTPNISQEGSSGREVRP